MNIGPHEILSPGTAVKVSGKLGIVLNHTRADNGVIVHRFRFTHRFVSRQQGYKPMDKPIETTANYSFVNLVAG